MTRKINIPYLIVLVALLCGHAAAQINTGSATQDVPAIDGGLGPCTLEVTVTADGKPVYAASVKVHIPYGFGGFHKLDLEGGTNSDGKMKFTGLPTRVRRPPLEFEASKGELEGALNYDPAIECRAKHPIVIEKPKP